MTVTSPNGGESWKQGTTKDITWTATGITGNVTIDLYKGGVFNSPIGTAAASAGTFPWDIPPTQTLGTDYKIRIYQGTVENFSDYNFSIIQDGLPIITVTTPGGGESWPRGTTKNVTWAAPTLSGNVRIDLYKNGVFNSPLGMAAASAGTFQWAISQTQALGTDYEIRIYQNSLEDYSDSNFSITDQVGFNLLHEFAQTDGCYPKGSLIQSGTILYGMTFKGGDSNGGTIFKIETNGTGFALLHEFAGGSEDGRIPYGSLILMGTTLYGMTCCGGDSDRGTIFKIETYGAGFSLLHEFVGGVADGSNPVDSLILSGSTLYGMTPGGGDVDAGTIFKIETDGSGFAILHKFAGGSADGRGPYGSLILSGTTLYGMTQYGGDSDKGTILKIETNGTGFTLLHEFAGGPADGERPAYSSLILSGATLYGMTEYGGESFGGTIFKIETDGTGFALFQEFSGDGRQPCGSLILSGTTLYGITNSYPYSDTIFKIDKNGTGFSFLHKFVGGGAEGRSPLSSLILSGTILYGMTSGGGDSGMGVIFSLDVSSLVGIAIITPNGGESWKQGTTKNITWTATGITGNVTIDLYKGGVFNSPIGTAAASAGTYAWDIPPAQTIGADYKIRIYQNSLGDYSDSNFSIIDQPGFNLLHKFSQMYGRWPRNSLIQSGSTLYGMTKTGGGSDDGTIFTIETNGTGFTLLHEFAGGSADGSFPFGSLILSGTTLYGMTKDCGVSDKGTIFKIETNGTGFTLLHEFAGGSADGGQPAYSSLILSGATLYGMTQYGGDSDKGTIFKIETDGSGFAILHKFAGGSADGSYPLGSLILSGTILYGMTPGGGEVDAGTIFKIETNGTGFTLLHEFAGGSADGSYPWGSLILSGTTLYGMTNRGGDSEVGTIFKIETNGTGFSLLHEFAGGAEDGCYPRGSLIQSATTLYGMTSNGGDSNKGTIFKIETNGTGFSLLHEFAAGAEDGDRPDVSSLILSGTTLYGMTEAGGDSEEGVIFSQDVSLVGIAVITPNGGETWKQGTTKSITWTATGITGNVTIDLYKGGVFNSPINTAAASAGTFPWAIPSTQTLGTDYKIRIYQGTVEDYSDNSFSIAKQSLGQIEINRLNFANVSCIANEFSVWFDIKIDGNTPSVSDYGIRIVDKQDNSKILAEMEGKPSIDPTSISRWNALLKIIPQKVGDISVPYFENGLFEVYSINDGSTYVIPETRLLLNVYGTDFDLKKHAYQFFNGSWNYVEHSWTDDFFKAGETLSTFIINPLLRHAFWDAIGTWYFYEIFDKYGWYPDGLCYGMASSSIANFTHRFEENNAWGIENNRDSYDYWISEHNNSWHQKINDRWPLLSSSPNPPHKPFDFNDIFNNTIKYQNWTLEAAKKIMYYFLAQPPISEPGWPGNDNENDNFDINTIREVMKCGNPILFSFKKIGSGFHVVCITQVINWQIKEETDNIFRNRYEFVIWNNNAPVASNMAPFEVLRYQTLDNNNEPICFQYYSLKNVNPPTGTSHFPSAPIQNSSILNFDGDSQRIYFNPTKTQSNDQILGKFARPSFGHYQRTQYLENISASIESGYHKITIIGANDFKVFDDSLNQEIELIREGDLDGNHVVYVREQGSILTALFLPAKFSSLYRIEVEKDPGIPRLKIFNNVLRDDGLSDVYGYEDIHKKQNDSTIAIFFIGRNNKNHTLQRVSDMSERDNMEPDYLEVITPLVSAIKNFKANVIGSRINLNWDNPINPRFAQVKIIRKIGSQPKSVADGIQIYIGNGTNCSDNSPEKGNNYYAAFSLDSIGDAGDWTYIMINNALYSISGVVSDGSRHIQGAKITLSDSDELTWQSITDNLGRYSLANISNGSYYLTCEATGYLIQDLNRTVTITNNSMTSDFHATPVKSITVTFPNGHEVLSIGKNYSISWKSTGEITNIKILFSIDNGETWISTPISTLTTNDGAYLWSVPANPSTKCLVRVSDASDPAVQDTSNEKFSIIAVLRPRISLSNININFAATHGGFSTSSQSVIISNTGGGTLNWAAASNQNWLGVTPTSGTGTGVIQVSVNTGGLSTGSYSGTIMVTDINASNSPQSISVNLTIKGAGTSAPPFGSFDTPADGTTGITGAIPITGWVVDDIEVTKVDIWRDNVAGETPGQWLIGDAIFVEGARPDIETAFPDYPLNYRAGWGYMMLTNFLPGLGNGTYKLYAYATDKEGNRVLLGTKTITCSNSTAVRPFGTIDSPSQGGDASGAAYPDFGWVLTPLPKTVAKDGSTVQVYVDSALVGALNTPPNVYNQYRVDVSSAFPGLNNSSGPVGAFFLDTTKYTNGVHTIAWVATDDQGVAEGIGSRYFNIVNTGAATQHYLGAQVVDLGQTDSYASLLDLPISFNLIKIKRGFNLKTEPEVIPPNNYGTIQIGMSEIEYIEVYLGKAQMIRGYQLVGNELRPLPIGSTLDLLKGNFSWMPGPGFLGSYDLVFIKDDEFGVMRKIPVKVTIRPKFEKQKRSPY